jgi:hypothetical protein
LLDRLQDKICKVFINKYNFIKHSLFKSSHCPNYFLAYTFKFSKGNCKRKDVRDVTYFLNIYRRLIIVNFRRGICCVPTSSSNKVFSIHKTRDWTSNHLLKVSESLTTQTNQTMYMFFSYQIYSKWWYILWLCRVFKCNVLMLCELSQLP